MLFRSFHKISTDEYKTALTEITDDTTLTEKVFVIVTSGGSETNNSVANGLKELGITNVKIDRTLARGFNYYTGTIFEIFDVSGENNRAMLGGGRYDNLTSMFGGEPITGIGFGMGDVTMQDFLETHNLLTSNITAPTLMVIPMEAAQNLTAQKIAKQFRDEAGISVATDISTKKIGKKIGDASGRLVDYIIVVGEDEVAKNNFTLKNMNEEITMNGTIEELLTQFTEGIIV